MNDRRRLMVLSVAVLTTVSLGAVGITAVHLLASVGSDGPEMMAKRLGLALGNTAIFVVAGACLLLRISQPLLRRLEQNERELRELVHTLEAKAIDLARANQELDEFTYVASHDLKEPLRGISAYCGILLDDYQSQVDENGRRMMKSLVDLCERLSRLIDDLLSYCRAGRTPETIDIDLNEVLDEVLVTLGPAIEARRGVVRRVNRLPTVRADATLIGTVLQNLITNGLKFNASRPPVVEISCRDEPLPTIEVRDNGIGIEPRHHEAIFAMFRRLHARNKYEGTGAGLSIARKIVEQHGGRMWVESQMGEGSAFYFTLPCGRQYDSASNA